jgi:hypothetical protein
MPKKSKKNDRLHSKIIPIRITDDDDKSISDFCYSHSIDRSSFLRNAVFDSINKYENISYKIRSILSKFTDLLPIAEGTGISISQLNKFKEEGGSLKINELELLDMFLCRKK